MTAKRSVVMLILMTGLLCFSIQAIYPQQEVQAFSPQVIQQGAVGDDVIELQARLQYLGFYNGKIDGVFGWGTYWALRNFQYEFGLDVDGLAGAGTKQKLVKASQYDKQFVKEQIRKGNDFNYYGGMDNNQQTSENEDDQDTASSSTTASVNVPQGYSQNDITLMANAVH